MQQVVKTVDEQGQHGSKEHLHAVTLKRQLKQILSTNNGIAFKHKLLKTTFKKLHKITL